MGTPQLASAAQSDCAVGLSRDTHFPLTMLPPRRCYPLLALASACALSRPAIGGGAMGAWRLRGGAVGFDLDELNRLASDPAAKEELQKILDDPEAMAEARAMMDDPEFRAQMMETIASGEADKLQQLKASIESDASSGGFRKLSHASMGACLDVLKMEVETAAEMDAACRALLSIAGRLAEDPDEPKFRRLRLSNPALLEKLLVHRSGRRCLKALGFSEEVSEDGEDYLELPSDDDAYAGALGRNMQLIQTVMQEVGTAVNVSGTHDLPYRIAMALPLIRRACARKSEDEDAEAASEFGRQVTVMLLQNQELKGHVTGPMAEIALPYIIQMLRSKAGLQGLLEYYENAPPAEGTRVVAVNTVSEWKAALDAAGERPVCALFSSSSAVPCRVLAPAFARLSSARDEGADEADDFDGVDFLRVDLDDSTDDGLTGQVFDEAFVGKKEVPSVLFFGSCLEHRKWRYQGADVGEIKRRLRRVVDDDQLEDGPGDDD